MKRRIAFVVFIVIFLCVLIAEQAFAGAWTVPKYKVWAQYYMKWEYAKYRFDQNWAKKSVTAGGNSFRNWAFTQIPEIDYGVTDWFNLQWGMQYVEAHYKEYNRSPSWGPAYSEFTRKNYGLTNVMLGAKYRLLKTPWVVSGQTRFYIYPGCYGVWHTDDTNYSNNPIIGYGESGIEQRILLSKKFFEKKKFPCYLNFETGYRWNNNHVCGGWPYFGEAGVYATKKLILKTELDGYKAQSNTGSLKNEAYGIWRIGAIWAILAGDPIERKGKQFNIEFDYGMTLWGKNTTNNQEYVLKAYTQF